MKRKGWITVLSILWGLSPGGALADMAQSSPDTLEREWARLRALIQNTIEENAARRQEIEYVRHQTALSSTEARMRAATIREQLARERAEIEISKGEPTRIPSRRSMGASSGGSQELAAGASQGQSQGQGSSQGSSGSRP